MTKGKKSKMKIEAPEKGCNDKKCPFHGNIKPRGRILKGVVLAKDAHRTATIERTYSVFIHKYERSEMRRSKIHAHNPPCLDAEIGDLVLIAETRPMSKTKNFVIIKKIGKETGFIRKLEAREEAKVEEKEEKTEEVAEKKGISEKETDIESAEHEQEKTEGEE